MHEALSATEFRQRVNKIVKTYKKLSQKVPAIQMIVFLDEINTSKIPGVIKEVMVDHTMDGVPLPSAISFCCEKCCCCCLGFGFTLISITYAGLEQ